MSRVICGSIREQLVSYLDRLTESTQARDICIVTVPVKTVDDRWVDVYVEPTTSSDYYRVHDGGKAFSELSVQGFNVHGRRQAKLVQLAARYGLGIDRGVITAGASSGKLSEAIWAVAQCSFLASVDLIMRKGAPENAALYDAIAEEVDVWGVARHIPIHHEMSVRGEVDQHTFDFVAMGSEAVVAINLLNPSAGSRAQAERYGFQALDLKNTSFGSWKRLAILEKPNLWSSRSLEIVSRVSDRAVEAADSSSVRGSLRTALDDLVAA